ncbi:MAG: 23S rRNA (guanine(2445)-N(2))/(guanine(2069)-N(7))-methyltransferase, partial [Actinobacteria bacterium]
MRRWRRFLPRRFEVRDVGEAAPPAPGGGGLLLTNPPYGERLAGSRELYEALGETLRARFRGWRAAVLCADEALAGAVGVRWSRGHALKNGALDVALHVGTVPRDGVAPARSAATAAPAADASE